MARIIIRQQWQPPEFLPDGWIAMDKGGGWYWYKCKPSLDDEAWIWDDIPDLMHVGRFLWERPPVTDWKESLREIKRKQMEEPHKAGVSVFSVFGRAHIEITDGVNAIAIHLTREGVEALLQELQAVLLIADEPTRKRPRSAEEVLLSDEFLQKFAKAFADMPLPSTIVTYSQAKQGSRVDVGFGSGLQAMPPIASWVTDNAIGVSPSITEAPRDDNHE